jgi:phage shock protein PspC (stress-responsive transcriptional regulator)
MPWNLHSLRKSSTDKCFDGICGAMGMSTPIPGWLWRVIFVACMCWGGHWNGYPIGIYFLLMLFMPCAEQTDIEKPAVEQPAAAGIAD